MSAKQGLLVALAAAGVGLTIALVTLSPPPGGDAVHAIDRSTAPAGAARAVDEPPDEPASRSDAPPAETSATRVGLEAAEPEPELFPTELDRTAAYGRVVDPDGTAIAAARVRLFDTEVPRETWTAPLAEVRTDAAGRFWFPELVPAHDYTVQIEAEGFALLFKSHHTGTEEDFQLDLESVIAGRVVERRGGDGVPGAVVTVGRTHFDGSAYVRYLSATADADGRFRIAGLAAGRTVELLAGAPGGLPVETELRLDEDPLTSCELVAAPGRRIVGRVVDALSGAALAGARLTVERRPVVEAGADGLFELWLGPDAALGDGFTVEADGYCRTNPAVDLAEVAASGARFDVALVPGGTVRGRVVDDAGEPVAGARVYASGRDRKHPAVEGRVSGGPSSRRQVTDAEGRFAVPELVPAFPGARDVRVSAYLPAGANGRAEVAPPPPSGEVEVEVVVPRGGAVHGRVLVGTTPRRADVVFRSSTTRRTTYANDAGEYCFDGLPPGPGTVNARVDRSTLWAKDGSDQVVVVEGEALEHDVVVDAGELFVAGRVTDVTGRPIHEAVVSVWHRDPDTRRIFSARGYTDGDGRYRLEFAAPEGLAFRVSAAKGPVRETLADVLLPREGVDLVLAETVELRIAVLDSASREPLPDFSLHWRPAGEPTWRRYYQGRQAPDSEGYTSFLLPTGVHDVLATARKSGYRDRTLEGLRVDPDPPPVELLLEPGTALRLAFTAEGDAASVLHRTSLVLVDAELARREGGPKPAFADFRRDPRAHPFGVKQSLEVHLEGVTPGTYRILVQVPKDAAGAVRPEVIEVPHTDAHRVELVFEGAPEALELGQPVTPVEVIEGLGYD